MKLQIHAAAIIILIVAFLSSFISIRIYSHIKEKSGDSPRSRGRMDDDDEGGNPDVRLSATTSAIVSLILTIGSVMIIIYKIH